jgi:hypothetical protein
MPFLIWLIVWMVKGTPFHGYTWLISLAICVALTWLWSPRS